ncbi:MAG TPA: hypothetical protein DDW52_09230 [Planctomycetaceae bacterium]|nr:hypothetical protein [Planctomycetaceae bacterium]
MAADGLGIGSRPDQLGPRIMTTIALLTGMLVGLAVLLYDFDRTPTIIAAQAATVVASPLVAWVLYWLTCSRDVMGELANSTPVKVGGLIGLALLVAMAGKTACYDLPAALDRYLQSAPNETVVSPTTTGEQGDE